MEPSFWHQRWQSNNIHGFHLEAPNPLLLKHWPSLGLAQGARVLVPLCGKTLDLAWLAEQGHRVVGAELSPLAVEQFFQGLGVTPTVTEHGALKRYAAPSLEIYQGNVFDLTPALLGPVDAVYDRAAMVALPPDLRERYAAQVLALGSGAPQLLLTYTYDPRLMDGPPFSIPDDEVLRHYSSRYRVEKLAELTVDGGLRGGTPALESVWRLARP